MNPEAIFPPEWACRGCSTGHLPPMRSDPWFYVLSEYALGALCGYGTDSSCRPDRERADTKGW